MQGRGSSARDMIRGGANSYHRGLASLNLRLQALFRNTRKGQVDGFNKLQDK